MSITDEQIEAIRDGSDGRTYSVKIDDLVIAIEERDVTIADLRQNLAAKSAHINELIAERDEYAGMMRQARDELAELRKPVDDELVEQLSGFLGELGYYNTMLTGDQSDKLRTCAKLLLSMETQLHQLHKPVEVEEPEDVKQIRQEYYDFTNGSEQRPNWHHVSGMINAYDTLARDNARLRSDDAAWTRARDVWQAEMRGLRERLQDATVIKDLLHTAFSGLKGNFKLPDSWLERSRIALFPEIYQQAARVSDPPCSSERDGVRCSLERHHDSDHEYDDTFADDLERQKLANQHLREGMQNLAATVVAAQERERQLREALHAARNVIGDHTAPGDCYSTGPVTGDFTSDLLVCPSCSFLRLYAALSQPQEPANGTVCCALFPDTNPKSNPRCCEYPKCRCGEQPEQLASPDVELLYRNLPELYQSDPAQPQPLKHEPNSPNDVEFRQILDWRMCSDPFPESLNIQIIDQWIENECNKRGYESFAVAYSSVASNEERRLLALCQEQDAELARLRSQNEKLQAEIAGLREQITGPWFLLFGGSSPDGCGPGKYVGRTCNAETAIGHIRSVEADSYSTGYVVLFGSVNIQCRREQDLRSAIDAARGAK